MAGKLTISTALAMILLGTSPVWAISTVTVPLNKDNASRFTDPANPSQKPVSGTAETIGTYGAGSSGFGGSASVSVGTPQFPAESQSTPGSPVPFGNPAFQNANRAFSNFPTDGAAADPTFGPNGAYAPAFNNKR
jgi:hypothetical protein